MLISEAFNMYKNDYMRMRRQSPRTEETHDYVSKNLSAFFKNKTIELNYRGYSEVGRMY